MKIHLTFLTVFFLVTIFSGCVSTSNLSYTPDVRKVSNADDILFRDLLTGIGGVGFVDEVFYPDTKERKIVSIEIITPYNNRTTGVEKWIVNHDGKVNVSYLVKLNPDGQGGTFFSVEKVQ